MASLATEIEPSDWYSARDAAELLDDEVTADTIKGYCRDRKVKAKRRGPRRQWFILGRELLRLRKEWELGP